MARYYNLEIWNIPSTPCLATRIPYGTELDPHIIGLIEKGESYLHSVGFPEVRLRAHGKVARIEVPPGRISEIVSETVRGDMSLYLKSLGFDFVSVDLDGYRTGSMNLAEWDSE